MKEIKLPHKLVSLFLVPTAAAVLVIGALSGCATATTGNPSASHQHKGSGNNPIAPTPSATPTAAATATATATPTPSGPAPLPANALFRISATVTAPGGASAKLVQTVFMPAAITAAQRAQMNTGCAGESDADATGAPWLNNYHTAWILSSTMTATLNPGSPAWNNTANGVLADFVGFGYFSGAYAGFEADCAPGFITIPGTQQAISPIQGTNPSGQPYGWAGEFGSYGFYGGGNDPGGPDMGGNAVVSHCLVQLSATAAANATAAAWVTHVPKLIDGCDYDGAQMP
jgi:hypothetical protein